MRRVTYCLPVYTAAYYSLLTTYYLLPTSLTNCYLPLIEAGEYGAVGPQQ